jgi:hypothetical protein
MSSAARMYDGYVPWEEPPLTYDPHRNTRPNTASLDLLDRIDRKAAGRSYSVHIVVTRARTLPGTPLARIASEIRPAIYGLVALLSFLVFSAAYANNYYAIAAPMAVSAIGFSVLVIAMIYIKRRILAAAK